MYYSMDDICHSSFHSMPQPYSTVVQNIHRIDAPYVIVNQDGYSLTDLTEVSIYIEDPTLWKKNFSDRGPGTLNPLLKGDLVLDDYILGGFASSSNLSALDRIYKYSIDNPIPNRDSTFKKFVVATKEYDRIFLLLCSIPGYISYDILSRREGEATGFRGFKIEEVLKVYYFGGDD